MSKFKVGDSVKLRKEFIWKGVGPPDAISAVLCGHHATVDLMKDNGDFLMFEGVSGWWIANVFELVDLAHIVINKDGHDPTHCSIEELQQKANEAWFEWLDSRYCLGTQADHRRFRAAEDKALFFTSALRDVLEPVKPNRYTE